MYNNSTVIIPDSIIITLLFYWIVYRIRNDTLSILVYTAYTMNNCIIIVLYE